MPELALFERLDQAIDALLAGGHAGSADSELAGLMEIAGALRDLPDDRFKKRLGAEFLIEPNAEPERNVPMPASTTAASAAIHAVTPFINLPEGAKLIDFMKHTFDAEEISRHPHGPD